MKQTKAKPGTQVEREGLSGDIADDWPDEHEFTATTERVAPEVTPKEMDRFVAEDLEPLVSGPVKITSTDPTAKGADKGISYAIPADELGSAVEVKTTDGELVADVDEARLTKLSRSEAKSSDAVRKAQDAGVTHRGGTKFAVTPSRTGVALDQKGVGAKIAEAMQAKGDRRSVEVGLDVVGVDLAAQDKVRRITVISPMRFAMVTGLVATGLLVVPMVGVALVVRPVTILVTVGTILIGSGMVRLGLWATRPTLRRVLNDGLARTE